MPFTNPLAHRHPARNGLGRLAIGAIAIAGVAIPVSGAGAAPTPFHLVSNYQGSNVYRFDGSTPPRTYATVANPSKIAISPDSRFAATTALSGGRASVIDLTSHQVTNFDYTTVGNNIGNPVFSSDSRFVFVPQGPNNQELRIHRIELATLASQTAVVLGQWNCGDPAAALRRVAGADQLWIACYRTTALLAVDGLAGQTFSPTPGTTHTLGAVGANGMAINPSGSTAYVAQNSGVVEVNLSSGGSTARAGTTVNCYAVIVDSTDDFAYAACDNLYILTMPTGGGNTPVRNSGSGWNTRGLALNPDGSQLWAPNTGTNLTGGTLINRFAVSALTGPATPTQVTSTPAFNAPFGIAFGVVAAAPDAPVSPQASAGNGTATVSWGAPPSDGGSPITAYTVTATPGNATCTATPPATTCTVTGLTNGTPYTFAVTATNAVGTSPASVSTTAVTPAAAPAPSPGTTTPSTPSATPNEATTAPSLAVRLLPSRRSLRAGQAMTLGVRTSNGASVSTAMARMRGQMAIATAEGVRTCVGLPANLVLTKRPSGSVRSGRTVCWSSGDIPAGQQRTAVLGVRAVAVQAVSRTISASARSTAGSQASARATAKASVRITPRAPRPVVTG